MNLTQSLSDWVVPRLHKVSPLRAIAKSLLHGLTLKQSFYGGSICLDAVQHAWAWTGRYRYETFDRALQDQLLALSQKYDLLIDIGSNIGAISLAVLLRNPHIQAVCIDPNARAIELLRGSIVVNGLQDRVELIHAAVSDHDGIVRFDEDGSVTGHISASGKEVHSIQFARLVNRFSAQRSLIKIDIEGFETALMPLLPQINHLHNLCLVIELHPLHFNQVGNPNLCLDYLLNFGAIVSDLAGHSLSQVEDDTFTQVVVRWPDA